MQNEIAADLDGQFTRCGYFSCSLLVKEALDTNCIFHHIFGNISRSNVVIGVQLFLRMGFGDTD